MIRRIALSIMTGFVVLVGLSSTVVQAVDCTGIYCVYLPFVTRVSTTPEPPPPTFNNCQTEPNPDAAPEYPVTIVQIDKVAETVTLQNVSQEPIQLDGWHMCSLIGNQTHPIGGVLAAGESRLFPNTGDNIWNNRERDDGALYNPNGQLVSYRRDIAGQ